MGKRNNSEAGQTQTQTAQVNDPASKGRAKLTKAVEETLRSKTMNSGLILDAKEAHEAAKRVWTGNKADFSETRDVSGQMYGKGVHVDSDLASCAGFDAEATKRFAIVRCPVSGVVLAVYTSDLHQRFGLNTGELSKWKKTQTANVPAGEAAATAMIA